MTVPTFGESDSSVLVIGAGPAGLTAAYLLARAGLRVKVLEADPSYVGGISKTVVHDGFRFDIGGHRFFSKSEKVERFWDEILPQDLIERPRSSRIYYNRKFFSYPLRSFEALVKLGLFESVRCVLSYLHAQAFRRKEPRSFEEWVTQRFGRRLFSIFFKSYTEKVWGMKCTEISADWAAQRIQGLSLARAILSNLRVPGVSRPRSQAIKTLIGTFRYPRLGPGMMWEECARKVREHGGEILMGHRVRALSFEAEQGNWVVNATRGPGSSPAQFTAGHVISSAPMRELVASISSPLPLEVREAAEALKYRDFLTVAIRTRGHELFPDNWIYIHDEGVRVGRIQNYKSWSPEMVPSPELGCYGLEYFCFEGDGLWETSDEALIELAAQELQKLGFLPHGSKDPGFLGGTVVRQKKAYPVYDETYAENVHRVRTHLEQFYPGLHLVGRNGMHKYNNQDHSIMTAMLTAENILLGNRVFDVWRVNQDAAYHEDGITPDIADRWVPERILQRGRESG